jgi:suppressor for copper-sensitivity B
MSLPWLFVALIPETAMLLPKPGRWMNTLKIVLGLMMLVSSLWLVTLLNLHLGEALSHIIMLILIVIAIVAYAIAGQRTSPLFWFVVIALSVLGVISCAGC